MSVNMHYSATYARVNEYDFSRINNMLITAVYNGYRWAYNPIAQVTVEVDTEYLRYACYWLSYRSMTASELVAMTIFNAKYLR